MASTDSVRNVVDVEELSRVTAEKIVCAVEQIVAKAKPLKVIAFGSRARGDHKPYSDLDLAVIMESYDAKVDTRPIWRSDVDVWLSLDLLVFGRERFDFMTGSIISVESRIAEEGVTLYDSAIGTIDRDAAARLT